MIRFWDRRRSSGRKRRTSAVFVIIFLALTAVIDYPFISRMMYEKEQSVVVMDYDNLSTRLVLTEKEELLAAAREYNNAQAAGLSVKSGIPFAETAEMDSVYRQMLNVDEKGVMAVVEIPKINVKLPVYHSVSEEALEQGAGHLEGSSLPVGGQSTHACIAAHRGLATKKMFTDLDQMEIGDVFFVQVLDEILAYQVYETQVVTPEETGPLRIEKEKDLITLITCTPYGINTHRIYVHGIRIPYEPEEQKKEDISDFIQIYWWIILNVVLLVWMCALLYWYNRKV